MNCVYPVIIGFLKCLNVVVASARMTLSSFSFGVDAICVGLERNFKIHPLPQEVNDLVGFQTGEVRTEQWHWG